MINTEKLTMECPFCQSKSPRLRNNKTQLGYDCYQCQSCAKYYNERTATPFNFLQYPTDVVLLTVFLYYRYKNSLVDVTEHMALRGFSISHETVRLWSQAIGTEIGIQFCHRRWKECSKKWHMDITYLFVESRWRYLYRAIDEENNLIDIYLSDTRDNQAAEKFFKICEATTGVKPTHITTDKEKAFPKAISKDLGKEIKHHNSRYLNNCIEQDHRGIKSRTGPMKGFKDSWCSMIFCHVYEEVRQFFRSKNRSLVKHRGIFASRFQQFIGKVTQIIAYPLFLNKARSLESDKAAFPVAYVPTTIPNQSQFYALILDWHRLYFFQPLQTLNITSRLNLLGSSRS